MTKPEVEKELQQQIDQLQEKLLFQEDTIQKLDKVVTKQYGLIDVISGKIKDLEEKMLDLEDEINKGEVIKSDEKPPHY